MRIFIPSKIYKKAADNDFTIVNDQTISYFRMKCMLTGKPIIRKELKMLHMLVCGKPSLVAYSNDIEKAGLIEDGVNCDLYTILEKDD